MPVPAAWAGPLNTTVAPSSNALPNTFAFVGVSGAIVDGEIDVTCNRISTGCGGGAGGAGGGFFLHPGPPIRRGRRSAKAIALRMVCCPPDRGGVLSRDDAC